MATIPAVPTPGKESLEGWYKFPVSRPLGRPVYAVIGDSVKLAIGGERRKSGGVIVVDGKCFDSNHKLWWRYVD